MELLNQALRGAARPLPADRAAGAAEHALVIGAGGTLGAALLAEALAAGAYAGVTALASGPLRSAVLGFGILPASALEGPPQPLPYGTAFVVFEAARHANGRDDAFVQVGPEGLRPVAAALHARGVRRLLVVVPHAPALLPQALKLGLATLDEAAVAAIGFEQLVFLRTAAYADRPGAGSPLQRFAGWWISQLRWMVPQREQPVRAVKVAALAVQLALRLRGAPPGTRVLPPEVMWLAAQAADAGAVFEAWLGGRPLPAAVR